MTTPADLIACYEALAAEEKTVVRLLCLNIGTMKQEQLLYGLLVLDSSGKASWGSLTKKDISAMLQRLEAAGLTSKRQGMTSHQPLLRNHVLLDVLEQGLFLRFDSCLESINKQKTGHYNRYYPTIEQSLRVLQGQLFGKASLEEVATTLLEFYKYFGHLMDDPLSALFGPSVPVPILRHSPHRQRLGFMLFEGKFPTLRIDPALVAMLVDDLRSGTMAASPFLLVLYLLLRGEEDLASSLIDHPWPECFSSDRACVRALRHFLQGNFEAALPLFAEALAELKKQSGKRKIALPNLEGIFHLCSLLAVGGPQNLELGKGLLDIARKQKQLPVSILDNLEIVLAQQMGLPHSKAQWSWDAFPAYPVYRFLYFLTFWWADREQAAKVVPEGCKPLLRDATKQGFPWLAAESASLLAAMGKEENQQIAEKLHARHGTTSCVAIVQPKDKSMQRLQTLLALAAKARQPEGAGLAPLRDQRLIWLFSHHQRSDTYSLTPVLQKLGKTGAWSKGRSVSLKTLREQHDTMEGLTDQDRRLCRTLSRDYGYYHQDSYRFDMDKALVAAIGHPLLFLEGNQGVAVELSGGELELRIGKKGGSLTIELCPKPPDASATTFVRRESATSFKVYRLSPSQANLAGLLNEKLVLPASATEQVRELASSLSSMVTVQSDVGGGQEAATVVADPLIHLHLLPFQDGLRVELFVRPIGPGGPWLQPGRGGAMVLGEQDGHRVQAKRELKKEAGNRDQLLAACPMLTQVEAADGQYFLPDPADSLELLSQLRQHPDCTLHWPRGQSFSLRAEAGVANLSLRINKDREWFAASGGLTVDEDLALDLAKLLEGLGQANGRFIPLGDGSFLALTRSLQKRLEELRAYSEKTKQGIRFNPLAALALEELTASADVTGDKQWKAHKARLAELVQPSVPSTLTASLRDYQVQGFNWLAQLSHWGMGACLADDMGLGKTLQALAAILLLAPKGPTLVVAPVSVAGNWVEEAARFAPTLQVKPFGQGDRQEMLDSLGPFDLVICSYGLLPVEGERLAKVAWQTVILDEAQAIKNRETKRAKAAMALSAAFRMVTTGTPIENHLGELWTLFQFINPGLLGSHQRFSETFATPIERDKDRNRLTQLQRLIRPFILRRMKHEVLQELPAKTEITLHVEMSAQEASLYEAQRRTAIARLEEGQGQGDAQHLQILAEIMKLRRLCCNPSLLLPEAGIASSKLKVFGDIVDELLENHHKALVFSQFVDHLAIIRAFLELKKIPYQYLDGSTPAPQRKERISAFQGGDGEVFLISLKAGGAGLNLTAADYVIHMDPWWNPAVEDQASDRAHRIGQERPVTVYRLVMKDSIEERIVGLHKDKRDLADALLDGAGVAGKLSAGDLLGLIRESGSGGK